MSATIAARAHAGATLSAPVRRAGRPKPARGGLVMRLVRRRPGRVLMILIFSAAAAAIAANALVFQKTRHPAPIAAAPAAPTTTPRAAAERPPEAQPVPQPVMAPLPPTARPSGLPREAAPRESTPRPAAPAAPNRPAAPAPQREARVVETAPRDPIADLINGGDLRPPAEIKGARPPRKPPAN